MAFLNIHSEHAQVGRALAVGVIIPFKFEE